MEVVVVKGDFSNGEIDAYMSDEAVSAIVNSLKFSK